MSIEVYGIPNCGTCKKAIKWLQDHSVDYQFINTKDNPPNTAMIKDWVKILGNKAMRNTSGKSYRDLGDEKKPGQINNGLKLLQKMRCCLKDHYLLKIIKQY
jgi:arsenate reductase